MVKIINLGHGCWQKLLIKKIDLNNRNQETDIFDWMKSYSFEKMILALENNFDIFNEKDIRVVTELKAYHNMKYDFYLPHEEPFNPKDMKHLIEKYNRRYKRFLTYKELKQDSVIIREVTFKTGDFSVRNKKIANIDRLEFPDDYNEENYTRIMKFLPEDCPFILFVYRKITDEERKNIYHKFIVIEEMMDFQESVRFNEQLSKRYQIFFKKISPKMDKASIIKLYDMCRKI